MNRDQHVFRNIFAPTRRLAILALLAAVAVHVAGAQNSFIEPLNPGLPISTVPRNGDINPYGVALVPVTNGKLVQGDILVSNFNNSANLQGTGTTIMEISPAGSVKTFAEIDARHLPGQCPGGVGLTTALVVLQAGWVIVGSLPTSDGTAATAQAGCLLVLNSTGRVVETFSEGLINGPWNSTVLDEGTIAALFFTNVLNGTVAANGRVVNTATVVRMVLSVSTTSPPREVQTTVIGSGLPARTDPSALVIGPTGVALSSSGDRLYVDDSLYNRSIESFSFRTVPKSIPFHSMDAPRTVLGANSRAGLSPTIFRLHTGPGNTKAQVCFLFFEEATEYALHAPLESVVQSSPTATIHAGYDSLQVVAR